MKRTHDAELCDRIRALEERVRELEARPSQTIIYQPYTPSVWPTYPWVWSSPNISVGGYYITPDSSTAIPITGSVE